MKITEFPKIIITFLKESQREIKRVNWPTREATTKQTLIVIAVSLVIAIYLGGLDFIFTTLLNTFIF
ncbi:preprotein translocase subunit SecE [Patescibacteria group bacterium]|nr:preprotein translocase subunit SecE [Patescibacteria group bacterium]MBU4481521.1 preprotein translocase subunit SecE [Patescibacteria group bacterium]